MINYIDYLNVFIDIFYFWLEVINILYNQINLYFCLGSCVEGMNDLGIYQGIYFGYNVVGVFI